MPRSTELPARLSDLTKRHALPLPDIGFHQALGRLIQSIQRAEQEQFAKAEQEWQERVAREEAARLVKQASGYKIYPTPPTPRRVSGIRAKIARYPIPFSLIVLIIGTKVLWDNLFPSSEQKMKAKIDAAKKCDDLFLARIARPQAIAVCREAIQNLPMNGNYHYTLGRLLKANSNLEEALARYALAVECDPLNAGNQEAATRLRSRLKK